MAKDYSKLEKDDLLKVIEKLESRKKYGLIWDEEKTKEQFEKESENALPVLKEVKGKEIKTDPAKPTNILIEGDNYHSLSVLNYTHQGKIDVIYIDPPYNTGNKDFKYNDRFIDREDSYRHSKWLSFMSNRLRLAKKLLSDLGVCFIHIDEHEIAQLLMYCYELFGEENVEVLVWEKTAKITNTKIIRRFKQTHEYIVVCYQDKLNTFLGKIKKPTKWAKQYTNPDNDLRGGYLPGIMSLEEDKSDPSSPNYYTIELPSGRKITREWYYSKEKFHQLLKDKRLYFPKKGDGVPRIKIFQNEEQSYYCNTILLDLGTITSAREEIREIFGDKELFDTPKPIKLGKELIRLTNKKDCTILDFFAGSGTVGHSVLALNKEDGGKRQFILCTNNELNGFEKELKEQGMSEKEIQEHGICRCVTYPRIEKAIKGYKTLEGEKIDGLGGNLKYFKTSFVKNSISRDDLKIRITRECTEMLCLREGIFGEIKAKPDYHIFEQNGRIMAVYYALEQNGLEQLKKELDKMKGEKILYCFTLDPLGLDKNDFADWHGVKWEAIPQPILDIYKEIYNL